jgi:methionyl-tRNA synthetase
MNRFYITTPIYYPNARPHVGSAYTTIVCDAIARYKRMCGYDVAFLTGTDEHGEKLQRAADAAGVPVERFVAEKRKLFTDLWKTLGMGEFLPIHQALAAAEEAGQAAGAAPPLKRLFVHTSQNPDHVKSVQWMIRQADKAGYVDKKKYEGRYCIYDERYVSDSPEPADCDICGRPAELIREENYFFKLSAFQDRLLKLYEAHPEFVQPDFRRNEVVSFVKSGLRDISISRRRLKWGIPWPGDPEQVVYVWYDALTSYLTGLGFRGEERGPAFEKYWMGAEGPSEVVHMIGKDILRFHAVYWPAFLLAAGLPLPKTVFAHGWIYYQQDKMSKSKGNVVYPEPIVKAFDEMGAPGNDALRYYLLRDTPFGQDGSFSYEGLIDRFNFDLANDLGNLANRTIPLVHTHFDGSVPGFGAATGNYQRMAENGWWPVPGDFQRDRSRFRDDFEAFRFSDPLLRFWGIIGETNRFLTMTEPWRMAVSPVPGDGANSGAVLYHALETVRISAVLLWPVIPSSAQALWEQLGCEGYLGRLERQRVDQLQWGQLKPGTKVGKPEPVFPRLDKQKTLARLHELAEAERVREKKSKEVPTQVEIQPEPKSAAVAPVSTPAGGVGDAAANAKITIDDFAKVELRVGEILSAEPIPGATKLLKLMVDIGAEVRQVCAGIAEHYKPEQLVGMKVVLVANLQPRKLRGLESNGMIVAASVGPEGKPVLATFKEEVPKGARLK